MDLVSVLGLVASVAIPLIGGLVAIGRAFQKLGDHDEEISEMKDTLERMNVRLEKTEDAVRNIGQLAQAVDNMGKRVGEQIGHLAEIMGIHNKNNERRFDDLTERLGERRSFKPTDK
jgi:hypothetical protein